MGDGFSLMVFFILALLSSFLYVWLGVAYSLTLISLLSTLGAPVNPLMPAILASQAMAAAGGSLYRTARERGRVGGDDAKGIALMALSSLVAFLSALSLGVRLAGDARSWAAVLILLASGASLLALGSRPLRGCSPGNRLWERGSQLASGVLGGLVKGVVGAGVTPVMLLLQLAACVEFPRVVYRTVFSEVGLLAATFLPYALHYGVSAAPLASMGAGALLGVLLGGWGRLAWVAGPRGGVVSGGVMVGLGIVSVLALVSGG